MLQAATFDVKQKKRYNEKMERFILCVCVRTNVWERWKRWMAESGSGTNVNSKQLSCTFFSPFESFSYPPTSRTRPSVPRLLSPYTYTFKLNEC